MAVEAKKILAPDTDMLNILTGKTLNLLCYAFLP